MNQELVEILKAGEINHPPASASQAGSRLEQEGSVRFDSLLGRLMKDLENLKQETSDGKSGLEAERINKPEEFKAALQDAGRKYQSCIEFSRNLIKAYQATLKPVEGS
ncbi:MAG: hypothetical protein ACYTG7_07775 [Planctomycetota bacterium]|jgi:hypothetical protein